MTRMGKSGLQSAGGEQSVSKRESVLDVAGRRREVLAARSVVEEVRRRLMQFRGEPKVEKEREKEKEEKMEEKARAAAWAWYQHGKGGKESVANASAGNGGAATPSIRGGGSHGAHKSSRFKTEALKVSGPPSGRLEHLKNWDFSTSRTSSLFDSYELDSVSKRIDDAFQIDTASAPAPAASQAPPPPTPKMARSSSLRLQFPRSICRSISDVVTHEEMALGADIRKCECHKNRAGRTGGWSFRRLSKALQVLMHSPECEYHPQQQHHERRQSREHHHEHHHHHHQHEHEHHHHIHYQVKLRDGMHYGNSFTTFPGKSDAFVESPKEKDASLIPHVSANVSPKISPELSAALSPKLSAKPPPKPSPILIPTLSPRLPSSLSPKASLSPSPKASQGLSPKASQAQPPKPPHGPSPRASQGQSLKTSQGQSPIASQGLSPKASMVPPMWDSSPPLPKISSYRNPVLPARTA